MIFYRTQRLLEESAKREPMLVELMHAFDLEAEKVGWKKVVVTSMWRSLEENRAAKAKTRIHCQMPIRACDIRIRDVDQSLVELVGKAVNARFQYDKRQPAMRVAIWALHGTGPHVHLQVHPNTKRIS